MYAYLSSGENQLSFLEGDRIALVGDRAKGWQFGENLRTHTFGWFPVAYTELEQEDNHTNWGATTNQRNGHSQQQQQPQQQQQHHHNPVDQTPDSSLESTIVDESIPSKMNAYHDDSSPTRMFGDTIMYRQSKQFRRVSAGAPKPGPPPTLPAPVPTPVVPASYPKNHISQSHSFSSAAATPNAENRKSMPAALNYSKQVHFKWFHTMCTVLTIFGFSLLQINQNLEMEWPMLHCTAAMTVVLQMIRHRNQMSTIRMKKI